MKWMTVLVMSLVLGCGGKKEEKKVEEEPEKSLKDRLGGLADKAKDLGEDIGDKAKDIGKDLGDKASDLGDKAKDLGSKVEDKAKDLEIEKHARDLGDEVARRAEGLSKDALSLGKDIKAKMDTARKFAKYNYDLSIDAQPEEEAAYKARHAKLKELAVGDYKVGFERRSTHPLGKVYKWQFMVGWRLPDGRTARLSIFTDDEIEELVLAAMLGEMLPLSMSMLK